MTSFLTQCTWVSEFQYMWNIPVAMRSIMLADVARADVKKNKKKEEDKGLGKEIKEGNLSDLLR